MATLTRTTLLKSRPADSPGCSGAHSLSVYALSRGVQALAGCYRGQNSEARVGNDSFALNQRPAGCQDRGSDPHGAVLAASQRLRWDGLASGGMNAAYPAIAPQPVQKTCARAFGAFLVVPGPLSAQYREPNAGVTAILRESAHGAGRDA